MTATNLAPIPELYVSADSAAKLKLEAADLPSWDLTQRQTCDLELLMNGGFHPLKGFLSEADYDSVCRDMRLADGTLWPMPITLDVTEAFADKVEPGQDIALRDQEGVILAIMSVSDKWSPDKSKEAELVFGLDDIAHPAVNYLHHKANAVYLGGPITGIQQPVRHSGGMTAFGFPSVVSRYRADARPAYFLLRKRRSMSETKTADDQPIIRKPTMPSKVDRTGHLVMPPSTTPIVV